MKWIKAALVGAAGSLVMFAIMMPLIGSGMAPFRMAPSAAALESLGFPAQPLAPIAHFGYGMVWSVVLVAWFGRGTTVWKGLGLAGLLWLVMMLVHSPMIGWGVFGTADTVGMSESLQLVPTGKDAVATFLRSWSVRTADRRPRPEVDRLGVGSVPTASPTGSSASPCSPRVQPGKALT